MQHNSSPKKALLGELESLIGILDDTPKDSEHVQNTTDPHIDDSQLFSEEFERALEEELSDPFLEIPLLNDIVPQPHSAANAEEDNDPSLLDLDRIFNDETFDSETEVSVTLKSCEDKQTYHFLTPPTAEEPIPSRTQSSEEEQSEMFPELEPETSSQASTASATTTATATATATRKTNHSVDLNLLIQELVDEFIPTLETQLRKQLSELGPDILQELAQKHL